MQQRLLHAAVSGMGVFPLRANFVTHDPDSQASVSAHGKLLTALHMLDLQLYPELAPIDCSGLTTNQSLLEQLKCIGSSDLLTDEVRDCLSRAGPLLDVNERLGVSPLPIALATEGGGPSPNLANLAREPPIWRPDSDFL